MRFIKNPKLIVLLAIFSLPLASLAQVDLFAEKEEPITDIVTATFKTTRVVNGHSIENVGAGILDFRILHRFGQFSDGAYNLFGLDQASIRLGLDYGITKNWMVGIGRSTFEKQYDAFTKVRLLSQTTGGKNFPISVSYAGTMIYKSVKNTNTAYVPYESDRFSFGHQLIIARKFGDYFSLQLTPTYFHYNLVEKQNLPNDFKSLGIASRIRLSKRLNLTGEYYYRFDKLPGYQNSLSVGFDIETGGHVFQLHMTNSTGMTERTFINETTGEWGKGNIRFGFNVSRVFTVRKPKEFRNKAAL
ncbi:MAG: hypothetical protein RLZZ595_1244 [Bacteroidota bacterium]|jgi:hypothetical protein